MDIRSLEYFLAVAQEESITRAAEVLHMTQPPLSREMKALEGELGKQLLIRGSRKVTLTEEGMLLRRRAEELVGLMEKTRMEIQASGELVAGICYRGGETFGMELIAQTVQRLCKRYPLIRVHLYSGNAQDVLERLDNGLLDFGLVIDPADLKKYDYLKLPYKDVWGLLMPRDHPLAAKRRFARKIWKGCPFWFPAKPWCRTGFPDGWASTAGARRSSPPIT